MPTDYDYNRPFIEQTDLHLYEAISAKDAARYGRHVRAAPLSNIEYKFRFGRFQSRYNMNDPPGCGRIFSGYVVVRRLGTVQQYETWMPEEVFEELYRKLENSAKGSPGQPHESTQLGSH